MLAYKLIAVAGAIRRYVFYIEDDVRRNGIVELNTESGRAEYIGDVRDFSHVRYASKLIGSLEDQAKEGFVADSGTVMWY